MRAKHSSYWKSEEGLSLSSSLLLLGGGLLGADRRKKGVWEVTVECSRLSCPCPAIWPQQVDTVATSLFGDGGRTRRIGRPHYARYPHNCSSQSNTARKILMTMGNVRRQSSPSVADPQEGDDTTIRLRIAGLGHHFELDANTNAKLSDLKEEVERRTEIPAPYLRLVAKSKKLDDDSMVLGPSIMDGGRVVEIGAGLEDRTKLLLLHSSNYSEDKTGIDKLDKLNEEIKKLEDGTFDDKTVQELIIQICCKIDCVETNGSDALRKMRKKTIKYAESVAQKSEKLSKQSARGIDP